MRVAIRQIPTRYVAFGAFQELLLPIVGVLVALILTIIWPVSPV